MSDLTRIRFFKTFDDAAHAAGVAAGFNENVAIIGPTDAFKLYGDDLPNGEQESGSGAEWFIVISSKSMIESKSFPVKTLL